MAETTNDSNRAAEVATSRSIVKMSMTRLSYYVSDAMADGRI